MLAGAAACSPRDAVDAALVMGDLAAGSGPSTLKELTPAPRRERFAFTIDGREHAADLYRPGDGVEAALVLVPGLAPAGRDDPRLVSLATTLARARFLVLVPDIPGFRAQRVTADDGAVIADATRHLRARPDGRGNLGIAAISYAAGPALIAAIDPMIATMVDFVVAVGGYYDTVSIVTYFTTGHYRADAAGPWQRQEPNAYGKWVFVLANAERLRAARDRVALSAMARRKLANLDADIVDLEHGLGPEAEAVRALLANGDPDLVPVLIERLPEDIRADLEALSLARRDLARLQARVVLIHGRDDAIVPWTESAALAAALPAERVSLTLLDSLAHADLSPGALTDVLRLWHAIYRVMGERYGERSSHDASLQRPLIFFDHAASPVVPGRLD